MESKRKHRRYTCDLPCRILIGQTVCEARVANVSLEGVYLESELMMDEGSLFRVEIEAGGPDPIAVDAELVHWRHLRPDDDEAEPMMGYGVLVFPTQPFRDLVDDLADAERTP